MLPHSTEPVTHSTALHVEQGGSVAGCRASPVFLTHVRPRQESSSLRPATIPAARPHLKKAKS